MEAADCGLLADEVPAPPACVYPAFERLTLGTLGTLDVDSIGKRITNPVLANISLGKLNIIKSVLDRCVAETLLVQYCSEESIFLLNSSSLFLHFGSGLNTKAYAFTPSLLQALDICLFSCSGVSLVTTQTRALPAAVNHQNLTQEFRF